MTQFKAVLNTPRPDTNPRQPADEFAGSLEEMIKSMQKRLPEGHKLRVYCQGKNGEDFRVGHIQITPTGVAVISGEDDDGNSMYTVSHFQRLQFVCEISKVDANEKAERKPIGFSR
jgi:hypothetical protein